MKTCMKIHLCDSFPIIKDRMAKIFQNVVFCSAIVFSVAMLWSTICTMEIPLISTGVFSFVFWIIVIWAILEYMGQQSSFFSRTEIWVLMAISFLTCLVMISILPALGQSCAYAPWDPKTALASMGKGKILVSHELRSQAWANYEILLSVLSIVFKGTLTVAQVANSLAHAIVLFPVFVLTERICGKAMARLVALLMAFLPPVFMYTFVLNSENISSCLIMFAGYFIIKALIEDSTFRNALLRLFFAGVFLGVSHLFKGMTVVFVLAAVFLMVVGALRNSNKMFLAKCIAVVLLMFPTYSGTKHVVQRMFANLAGKPELCIASSGTSSLLYELVLGFNVESTGHYNHQLCQKFLALPEKEKWPFFKDRVARDWRQYPRFMIKKFMRIHGAPTQHHGCGAYFSWTFIDAKGRNRIPKFLLESSEGGSLVFKVLFLMGTLGLFLCRGRSFECLAPGLFSLAVVLSFAGVQQLIESNGRYKISVYPFYFMVIPYMYVWFHRDNPIYLRLRRWYCRRRGAGDKKGSIA